MSWLTWFPYRLLTLHWSIVCCNRAQKQSVVGFCFVLSCNLWLIFADRRIMWLCAGVSSLSTAIIFFHLQGVVCSTKIARSLLLTIIVFNCCFLHWNHIQSNSHLIGRCWCMSFGSYIWLCVLFWEEKHRQCLQFLFLALVLVGLCGMLFGFPCSLELNFVFLSLSSVSFHLHLHCGGKSPGENCFH